MSNSGFSGLIKFVGTAALCGLLTSASHGQGLGSILQSSRDGVNAAAEAVQKSKSDETVATVAVRGNNAFALDLYGKLAQKAPATGNVFFSPYSISSNLGLAYSGSQGATTHQLARAMQLNVSPQALPASWAALRQSLDKRTKTDGGYQLTTANAVWGQQGLGFRPEFVELVKNGFAAEVRELNFKADPEKARTAINTWVSEETRGKFPQLLSPGAVNAGTEVVLTNAVYCKAAWQRPFPKKATEEAPFFVKPEQTVKVPLMKLTGAFSHYKGKDFQLLELPYLGGELSMIVLLPDRKNGLPQLEQSLTFANLNDWLSRLKKQDVQVLLPRFKINYDTELREVLSALGMGVAFSLEADFTGMTGKKNFHLSAVMHKAYVSVNEEGTEAAAATASFVERSIELPAAFRADHPFVFLLRDTRNGCILFMGRLVNP